MPFKGMVAVEAKTNGDDLPRKENLLIMSPEELCHIYLLAIDDAVSRGESDGVLETWKKYCLSVCFEYVDVSGTGTSPVFWWSWNHREQVTVLSDAVKRTAYQRACEVAAFKEGLDKQGLPCNHEAIAVAYKESVKVSSKSVDISQIRECLSVYERVCSSPELSAVMDRLEKRFGLESCLNSMNKLQKIIEKTDNHQQRKLVFEAIEDSIIRGIHSNSRFSREFLIGSASTKDSGSSIPFVAFVILKWKIKQHLLLIEMPREKLDIKELGIIGEKTKTYEVNRACEDDSNDKTWVGAMMQSSVLAYRIIQAIFKHNIS